MNQIKPKETLAGQECPFCHAGKFRLIQVSHRAEFPDHDSIVIPNVWVDKCDNCREVVYPPDTTQFIEQVVDDYFESLTPTELQLIRKAIGVDQTQMSDLLCLGSKTYHRWENGDQFPNRSMSCYIRIVAEFPDVLEWLRRRAWRKTEEAQETVFSPVKIEYPSLDRMRKLCPSELQELPDALQKANFASAFHTIGIE
jgi:YgiT-type zinc finger domain-containing protein